MRLTAECNSGNKRLGKDGVLKMVEAVNLLDVLFSSFHNRGQSDRMITTTRHSINVAGSAITHRTILSF